MHQLTEHVKWSRPAWPKILCSWLSYALWEITGQVLSLHLQCVAPRVVPLLFLHTCVIWNIWRTTVSAMAGQQTLLNYFCVGTYFTGVTIPLNSQTKNGLRVFMLNAACSDRVQLILCLIKCHHIVGRNKKMCDIQVLCQIVLFSCYSTANVPRPATSLQPSCSVYQGNMQCPTLVLLEVI